MSLLARQLVVLALLALSDDCLSDPKTTERVASRCDFDSGNLWKLKC